MKLVAGKGKKSKDEFKTPTSKSLAYKKHREKKRESSTGKQGKTILTRKAQRIPTVKQRKVTVRT